MNTNEKSNTSQEQDSRPYPYSDLKFREQIKQWREDAQRAMMEIKDEKARQQRNKSTD